MAVTNAFLIFRLNRILRGHKRLNSNLSIHKIPKPLQEFSFDIIGPIYRRSQELAKELKEGCEKPFSKVVFAGVCDLQGTGQKPITFHRQVLAQCLYPDLMTIADYPEDTKIRAKEILAQVPGGLGSYTQSTGLDCVKKQICVYLTRRDCYPSALEDIVLISGITDGLRKFLMMLPNVGTNETSDLNTASETPASANKQTGILVPKPGYPLYPIIAHNYGMVTQSYYLDECNDWTINLDYLKEALGKLKETAEPRVLIVNNPHNPTGSLLTQCEIQKIIQFCEEESLCIIADETYQQTILDPNAKFVSFKKAMMLMTAPCNQRELISFMSCSKNFTGEGGLRGGCMELVNIDPKVKAEFLKLCTVSLCASTPGQVAMGLTCSPPNEEDPSYELYCQEKAEIMAHLVKNAKIAECGFNKMEGVCCPKIEAGIFAFPKFCFPVESVAKAQFCKLKVDELYCMELLEATGIAVTPGHGFGQLPERNHIRVSITSQNFDDTMCRFQEFHRKFMKEFQ